MSTTRASKRQTQEIRQTTDR